MVNHEFKPDRLMSKTTTQVYFEKDDPQTYVELTNAYSKLAKINRAKQEMGVELEEIERYMSKLKYKISLEKSKDAQTGK